MRLLLDTHALLWWQTADPRLSRAAFTAISNEDNQILVSAASAWEIAIKTRLNKLESIPGAADRFAELIAADGFTHLPISHRHALRAGGHPSQHKDPFDRMLAAQSEIEGLHLVTTDAVFADFGTQVLW